MRSRFQTIRRLLASVAALAGAAGLATFTYAPAAEACGGFFCSAQQPVVQNAERIIFVHNDDGTVTGVIQIQYQGPSERFSWVLPVPGVPDVAVSSNVAFNRLQQNTNPQYTLNTEVEGTCGADARNSAVGGDFSAAPPSEAGNFDADGQAPEDDVNVVGQGSVGPYDYEVISVNPDLTDPADVAVDWLEENGYDVGAIGPDVLRPYLEKNLNLLAFRLTKQATAGDIRPVAITFDADLPMIPIQPTAVAANDDMGVMVFVVGDHRAVPVTYRSLVLNEAVINWFFPTSNYDDVINLAADEAGGHGFVTELAQPSERVENVVWTDLDQQTWDSYLASTYSEQQDGSAILATSQYAGWDGYAEALRAVLPEMVNGATADQIALCPGCFLSNNQDIEGFSLVAFKEALRINVVEPMIATQELLVSQPYVTRMYTTLSADEMTEDPVFDFNPDLNTLDNQHTATRVVECSINVSQFEAPWRVQLPQGQMVRGVGFGNWPASTDDMPANYQVIQDSTQGPGEVINDNAEEIDMELGRIARNQIGVPDVGCEHVATGRGSAASGAAGLAVILGLGAFARRRRR